MKTSNLLSLALVSPAPAQTALPVAEPVNARLCLTSLAMLEPQQDVLRRIREGLRAKGESL